MTLLLLKPCCGRRPTLLENVHRQGLACLFCPYAAPLQCRCAREENVHTEERIRGYTSPRSVEYGHTITWCRPLSILLGRAMLRGRLKCAGKNLAWCLYTKPLHGYKEKKQCGSDTTRSKVHVPTLKKMCVQWLLHCHKSIKSWTCATEPPGAVCLSMATRVLVSIATLRRNSCAGLRSLAWNVGIFFSERTGEVP